MIIPFLDMKREAGALLSAGLMADIQEVIKSGQYLFGPKSQKLEQRFMNYFNSKASLVGSGTDGLIICLRALGVKPGDKVAIPAMTAIPTAIAVKAVGGEVVYIDVDETLTMSPEKLSLSLELHNCKAIIAVHLYGNSCNMDEIIYLAAKFNIPVIEDCAQSFGTIFGENRTGTIGTFGAFSFYPSKNLGCFGDAGLIISKDETLMKSVNELRFYGQTSRYKMGELYGLNSRTDEIQSAILLRKMDFMKSNTAKRKKLFNKYKHLKTIKWRDGAVPHLFPLIVENRDKLIKYLTDKGIETAIHYPFYLENEIEKTSVVSCPEAKKYSEQVLSIPFYPWLTELEADYIIEVLKNYG